MPATFRFTNTDLRPTTDLQLDLGTDALRFNRLFLGGITQLNDINYTWPATQTADFFLRTDGAGALSWAEPTATFISVKKWGLL